MPPTFVSFRLIHLEIACKNEIMLNSSSIPREIWPSKGSASLFKPFVYDARSSKKKARSITAKPAQPSSSPNQSIRGIVFTRHEKCRKFDNSAKCNFEKEIGALVYVGKERGWMLWLKGNGGNHNSPSSPIPGNPVTLTPKPPRPAAAIWLLSFSSGLHGGECCLC